MLYNGAVKAIKKAPEAKFASGTNRKIRGTTLVALRAKPLSDSVKSKADNGATVLHYYLSLLKVHKADSGSSPPLSSAPAHTIRRLSGAFKKGIISVNVF